MKTIKEDRLRCYVGHTWNDNNPYSFCLMPDSGMPTIEKAGYDIVRFMDKDVDSLLTLDQKTELKKTLNTISYNVKNKKQEEPSYAVVTNDYGWMEFEFVTAVSVQETPDPTIRKTVVKVTNENMKRFLDELQAKKKADLDELERRFLYYFGNTEQNAE